MNGRIMEQASYADWIHTLRVETYSPLQSLHLQDCFPMPGALLGQETVYADAHGNFSIAVREKVTLRCGFTLYADEPKYVSLILTSDTVCKVWQEQRVINLFKVCSPVLTVRLKRGENVFFADACVGSDFELSIRQEAAAGAPWLAAAGENNLDRHMPQISLYIPRHCYADGANPTWIVTPNDARLFDARGVYHAQFSDHRTGRRICTLRCRFGELCSLPHQKLPDSGGDFNRADMLISSKDRKGRIHTRAYTLYREDYMDHLPQLLERADSFAGDMRQREERRAAVTTLGMRIRAPETTRYTRLLQAEMLKAILETEDVCTEAEVYAPGTKRVFFHDALDDSMNYYRVTLPQGYDPRQTYPLFVICSTKEYGTFGARFAAENPDNLIVADVSVRGVTLGSYIGEAALLHALADLQKRFSIDADRVYIGGYSNGASAALAAAQAYPHLFAGVYALSGRAEYGKMDNLSESAVYLISSEDDTYYDSIRKLCRRQAASEKMHLVLAKCHNHLSLQRVWLDRQLIANLLREKRELYPTHISYCTTRNRHLQAYWIKLHGIRPGTARCRLYADAGKSRIDIRVYGATGLSVEIPPYMERESLEVRINGKKLPCHGFSGGVLHFKHDSHGYRRISAAPLPPDTALGNGLIDVYLDPLCAVIPTEASQTVRQAASVLTRPLSNGKTPQIAVWYKTLSAAQVLTEKLRFGSIILIGREKEPVFDAVHRRCRLLPLRDGFVYDGKFVRTPYCIMQIVQNPWNPEKHVLSVTYNDERLLRRNLFTRSMTLPSYFGGVHPYLNGVALVFDGKRYFGIREYGDPLLEIRAA